MSVTGRLQSLVGGDLQVRRRRMSLSTANSSAASGRPTLFMPPREAVMCVTGVNACQIPRRHAVKS